MEPQTQIASRNGGQLPAGLCTAVRRLQARQNTIHNVSQLFKTINTALEVLPDSAVTWRGVAMLRTGSTPFSFRSEIKNLAHSKPLANFTVSQTWNSAEGIENDQRGFA